MTLELSNVRAGYGLIQVLQDVSLIVNPGEVVALVGSNGAGKTTILRAISGIVPVSQGRVAWKGRSLHDVAPHDIILHKVAHVPEGRQIFSAMSVIENLMMGAYRWRDKATVSQNLEQAFSLFPRLRERSSQTAGKLSGGEQQMLALGRALMSSPELLLLDEPSMGLSPIMIDQIFDAIEKVSANGMAVLLVEQNVEAAFRIARRAYVIRNGAITKSAAIDELRNDDLLREAYFGSAAKNSRMSEFGDA